MANQFQSTSSGFATLKNWYEGPIVSQFNDEVPLYRGMEKGNHKYNGLQVIRPLKVLRNPGIGATSDGGLLAPIGRQTTVQAIIAAKFNYLRFGITGPMLKASQGDKGAFISEMEFEMNEGMTDFKNDVNRQLFWNGRGDLALVAAAAVASNVITVNGRTASESGDKYLQPSMVVDIVDAGTLLVKYSAVTLTSVSNAMTSTVVLSQAVTVAAGDIIVRTGALNQEIQGILTQLDGNTTTVFNVDRSAYPVTQGNSINAGGAALSLNLLQQTLNELRRKGGGKLSTVYSDFDSERFYNKLLVADRRYIGDKVKGDGTFSDKDKTYLEYAGVAWVADKDCPLATYMLQEKSLIKYVLSDIEWADESGAPLIVQTSSDAYEARLRFFANVFNEKPSASARLHNYISS